MEPSASVVAATAPPDNEAPESAWPVNWSMMRKATRSGSEPPPMNNRATMITMGMTKRMEYHQLMAFHGRTRALVMLIRGDRIAGERRIPAVRDMETGLRFKSNRSHHPLLGRCRRKTTTNTPAVYDHIPTSDVAR
jgi:hypothetical protein